MRRFFVDLLVAVLTICVSTMALAKNKIDPESIGSTTLIMEPMQEEIFISHDNNATGAGMLIAGILGLFVGQGIDSAKRKTNRRLLEPYDGIIDWQDTNQRIVDALFEAAQAVPSINAQNSELARRVLRPEDVRQIIKRTGDSNYLKAVSAYYLGNRGREFIFTVELQLGETHVELPGFRNIQYKREYLFVSEPLEKSKAYEGEPKKKDYLARWFADDGARLKAVLEEAIQAVRQAIIDDMNGNYVLFKPGRVRLSARYVVCRYNAYQEVGKTLNGKIIATRNGDKELVIIPQYTDKKECKGS